MHDRPNIKLFSTPEEVSVAGAEWLADQLRIAVDERGRCTLAVSGGRSPWPMLKLLAKRDDLPWEAVWLFQVDERIAPDGDEDRNLTQMRRHVLSIRPELEARTCAMPVNDADPVAGAVRYAGQLEEFCGSPSILDIIHLGLGPDGHTASLVPGDEVLEVLDRDVALTTDPYQGHRRMTLTYPTINRARNIMWQVVGADKRDALAKMMAGDNAIPGGRIESSRAMVFADQAAGG